MRGGNEENLDFEATSWLWFICMICLTVFNIQKYHTEKNEMILA